MEQIVWSDFEKVQILAGTIVEAESFPEAVQKNLCKAMQLHIDTSGEQQF